MAPDEQQFTEVCAKFGADADAQRAKELHLSAAAPDLLAALHLALARIVVADRAREQRNFSTEFAGPGESNEQTAIRAAIAKAEGKA